ncbi:MAG: HEAT repeat domain-containing protein [Planctomycetes bacterium]|nr:HEAT repeat domain-containing protein [Planctomycetota bacterium]
MRAPSALPSLLVLLAAQSLVPGQQPAKPAAPAPQDEVQANDIAGFRGWLQEYHAGKVRLSKDGQVDEAALADLDVRMAKIAQWNTLAAARLLFEAASVDTLAPSGAAAGAVADHLRERQPWRVQKLAAKHLRTMTGDGVVPFLLSLVASPDARNAKKQIDQKAAAAALRVLGGHPSLEAKLELIHACHTMPPELRVQAVNAMANDSTLELVPTLVEMLRDSEPNVRIAAATAIGTALQPHTDETTGKKPDAATVALRDQCNKPLEELLVRDAVWQVRSAAATALAIQKCKAVIPILIRGLDAELQRKKDPWAMDVRLHKLLEGLTGQSVVRGSIDPWKAFWTKEGPGFVVRPASEAGKKQSPGSEKYGKFFDLEIESDRVLFVLDFSGSMAEEVTLKARTTVAGPGTKTTKAALIVAEMKKMVMSLPDGALVNFVVFGDTARAWRQDGGRPALVKLDDSARDDLLGTFLDSLRPNGPTNLYDALDLALAFGGRGLHDKYYGAGFDTLYVITDGAPSAGSVTDKDEIRRRVRETNGLRRIAIHCITFGDKNDTDFLAAMAAENGGRHIHVE